MDMGADSDVGGSGPDSGTDFLRSFGRQVKLLREAAGLTQAQLGIRVGYGEAQIAAVEQARRIPKPELIDAVDRALDARGVLLAMKGEVAKARYPSFFRRFASYEAEAAELHAYDTHVVNGIVQCEEYMRAVFRMWRPLLDTETVEQRVAARLDRQRMLARRPAPLLSFVVEEHVFLRPLGGRDVHRAQLEHLLAVGHERHIEIQVMPVECDEHAGVAGPFTLILTRSGRRMAYTEVQSHSSLHTEPVTVRGFESSYGALRAQAKAPKDSLAWIEKLLGEL
ncbi:helix-turn-helix transcriptional regulator [Streptomyces sp. TP-A0875]|uniref:helix-turn-helix domain-containing protein n=1 Tax=Streptomyces sp. TP-A0875 TaxID=552354 RepID=UPI0006B4C7EE|nr:helix-turn-helix transcriptional regulator [Streptomyces sp. TP-A0875]